MSGRGKKKAIAAVGRSILICIWNVLAADDAVFADLAEEVDRINVVVEAQLLCHLGGPAAAQFREELRLLLACSRLATEEVVVGVEVRGHGVSAADVPRAFT